MKAVLLAAGLGTRLRPLTDTLPKCLAPIHGKPLLGYWFDLLFSGGVSEILVNTHCFSDQVEEFVWNNRWSGHVRLVYEPELQGTGGTLLANRRFLDDAPFLVAHADNLTCFDVQAFMHAHANRKQGVLVTMMTFTTPTPESSGIVEIDTHGIVQAFHEKVGRPPSDLANAAVYVFEPDVLDFMGRLGQSQVDISTEVLPHFLGRMQVYHNEGYHRDIGTMQSWQEAQKDFKGWLA